MANVVLHVITYCTGKKRVQYYSLWNEM